MRGPVFIAGTAILYRLPMARHSAAVKPSHLAFVKHGFHQQRLGEREAHLAGENVFFWLSPAATSGNALSSVLHETHLDVIFLSVIDGVLLTESHQEASLRHREQPFEQAFPLLLPPAT